MLLRWHKRFSPAPPQGQVMTAATLSAWVGHAATKPGSIASLEARSQSGGQEEQYLGLSQRLAPNGLCRKVCEKCAKMRTGQSCFHLLSAK
jgi:hypothetical protein